MLLCTIAVGMLIPLGVEFFIYEGAGWRAFALSSFVTGLIGSLLALSNYVPGRLELRVREAFILTSACWLITPLFAGLPFYWSDLSIGFIDACFEGASSLTTTGATTLTNLQNVPKGVLLWRALLQWLGGTGIIVMAMTVLPILRIGGMQLFRSEFSDRSEKILPRVSQIAAAIIWTYVVFTVVCMALLYLAGMNFFDAICHSMATVSTGGLSTHDASVAIFKNPNIHIILIIFMIIGGSPFILFIRMWHGNPRAIFTDSQFRTYLGALLLSSIVLTVWHWSMNGGGVLKGFRESAFMVVSTMTSTGFTLTDYTLWGNFPVLLAFVLGIVGGCTGSTSGGIKIFRFQVLASTARTHLRQLRRPHGVYLSTYQTQKISDAVILSVFTLVTLYGFSLIVIACGLSMFGLDFITCISGAAATLSNLGPGLGDIIGPAGSYASLGSGPKILLMFGMVLGRLELLTIFVLFMPSFWKD